LFQNKNVSLSNLKFMINNRNRIDYKLTNNNDIPILISINGACFARFRHQPTLFSQNQS
jgi:hypothetical protein